MDIRNFFGAAGKKGKSSKLKKKKGEEGDKNAKKSKKAKGDAKKTPKKTKEEPPREELSPAAFFAKTSPSKVTPKKEREVTSRHFSAPSPSPGQKRKAGDPAREAKRQRPNEEKEDPAPSPIAADVEDKEEVKDEEAKSEERKSNDATRTSPAVRERRVESTDSPARTPPTKRTPAARTPPTAENTERAESAAKAEKTERAESAAKAESTPTRGSSGAGSRLERADTVPVAFETTPTRAATAPDIVRSGSSFAKTEPEATAISPDLTRKTSSFRDFMNRPGPSAPGSKEIPEGKPNCLQGLPFLFTGVMSSIEREDAQEIVRKYGGTVAMSVTKKLKYAVIGEGAGVSKLEKLEKHPIAQMITEDDFLNLLRTLPEQTYKAHLQPKPKKRTPNKGKASPMAPPGMPSPAGPLHTKAKSYGGQPSNQPPQDTGHLNQLWADKYRPRATCDLIGNTAKISYLHLWLRNWQRWHVAGDTTPFPNGNNRKAVQMDKKAVLMAGPPGIGKTSSAHIVARECGYEPVEFNASDTRSKKSLQASVADMLGNQSIGEFFGSKNRARKKICVIMDEVDGMSGGDRGGMAELINLIRTTKVPIICMCNDRDQKVRSLANHTFFMNFQRPNANQVRERIMKVAKMEGFSVDPNSIHPLVEGANGDIRQIFNLLQTWRLGDTKITHDSVTGRMKTGSKHIAQTPFQLTTNFLQRSTYQKASIDERLQWYFGDSAFIPLFMQENYLKTAPAHTRMNKDPRAALDLIARASDSIAMADVVDNTVRSRQAWKLMPFHGLMSCVVPSFYVHGEMRGQMNFPGWLGKNSSRNKFGRILGELQRHTAMSSSCNKSEMQLDVLPTLSHHLVSQLSSQDGIPGVIEMMREYNLTREDYDSIMELSEWSGRPPLSKRVDTKTKSAFTRRVKKEMGRTRFNPDQSLKKTKSKAQKITRIGEDGEDDDDDDDDDDDEGLPAAKKKKASTKGKRKAPKKKKAK